jgi:hypothetical protein
VEIVISSNIVTLVMMGRNVLSVLGLEKGVFR